MKFVFNMAEGIKIWYLNIVCVDEEQPKKKNKKIKIKEGAIMDSLKRIIFDGHENQGQGFIHYVIDNEGQIWNRNDLDMTEYESAEKNFDQTKFILFTYPSSIKNKRASEGQTFNIEVEILDKNKNMSETQKTDNNKQSAKAPIIDGVDMAVFENLISFKQHNSEENPGTSGTYHCEPAPKKKRTDYETFQVYNEVTKTSDTFIILHL